MSEEQLNAVFIRILTGAVKDQKRIEKHIYKIRQWREHLRCADEPSDEWRANRMGLDGIDDGSQSVTNEFQIQQLDQALQALATMQRAAKEVGDAFAAMPDGWQPPRLRAKRGEGRRKASPRRKAAPIEVGCRVTFKDKYKEKYKEYLVAEDLTDLEVVKIGAKRVAVFLNSDAHLAIEQREVPAFAKGELLVTAPPA